MRIQIKSKINKFLALTLLMLTSQYSNAACSISSANFAFGGYSIFADWDKESSSGIYISCNSTTSITIKLSSGNSGNYASRYMLQGTSKLYYNVYIDSGKLSIFGDGTSGTSFYTGTAGKTTTYIPVFGRIPAKQQIPMGQYTDTLTVQLVF